jgi:Mor family transcriptional regulator
VAKGRCRAKGQLGEKHGMSILKNEDVLAIRADHALGNSYSKLMDKYKMSKSQIARIVTRKSWSHI